MFGRRDIERAESGSPDRQPGGRRKTGALWALGALAVGTALFCLRQNRGKRIGGRMSLPKVFWLNYALSAWFVVPYYFWCSRGVSPGIRRVYGAHLLCFGARGAAELWLLYITHSWVPPYGISHDLFQIGLISLLIPRAAGEAQTGSYKGDPTALRFLTSIRLGLVAEVLFAWLFYRAVQERVRGSEGIWFADDDTAFRTINRITTAVVCVAYADLARTLWYGRDALLPLPEEAGG